LPEDISIEGVLSYHPRDGPSEADPQIIVDPFKARAVIDAKVVGGHQRSRIGIYSTDVGRAAKVGLRRIAHPQMAGMVIHIASSASEIVHLEGIKENTRRFVIG
jgi:hypothetical protein